MNLPDDGRCCGKQPLTYKRRHMLFCTRCSREFDMDTKEQRPNFAWRFDGVTFVSTRPQKQGPLL